MSSERPMKGALIERLRSRSAVVCVVGMGYVGLPLAIEFARRGFRVVGKDSDEARSWLAATNWYLPARGTRCRQTLI